MSEEEKEEEKIKFKIQGKEYEIDKKLIKLDEYDHLLGRTIEFKEPQEISFNIVNVPNKNKKVNIVSFYDDGNKIFTIDFAPNQKISFNIGDVGNKNVEVERVFFKKEKNNNVYELWLAKPHIISFSIDNDMRRYCFNGELNFYNEKNLLSSGRLDEDIDDYFYYKGKKYKLSFKRDNIISFKEDGELEENSILGDGVFDRLQQITEQNGINDLKRKIKKLENEQKKLADKQSVATWGDRVFVVFFIAASIGSFCVAWFKQPMIGNSVSFVGKNPDINKYVFLYEILKRAPIIILVILGFKFLQLAFERLRLIGKVEQVRNYIALTADDDTKKELLKMIAIPFFAPKKVKSSFFDKLIEKLSFGVNTNLNNQPNDGTTFGVNANLNNQQRGD